MKAHTGQNHLPPAFSAMIRYCPDHCATGTQTDPAVVTHSGIPNNNRSESQLANACTQICLVVMDRESLLVKAVNFIQNVSGIANASGMSSVCHVGSAGIVDLPPKMQRV